MNDSVLYLNSILIDNKALKNLSKLKYSKSQTKRLCFHEDNNSEFHKMVVEANKNTSFPAHLHLDSDEIIFILNGRMKVLIWNEGNEKKPFKIILDSKKNFNPILIIPKNITHSTENITKTRYVEFKLGPFKKNALVFVKNLYK